MSRKHLLTISMLSLLAMSTVAHAGTTISDKRYWPNVARASATKAGDLSNALNSATVPRLTAPQFEPATSVNDGGSPLGRYQGGPKPR
jgi:hypothetical protein